MNDELIKGLVIGCGREPTVFPDTWPISSVYDVRAFPELRPGAFVSQLGEHRSVRGGEERIGVVPPLNEPLVEPPVLIASGVLRPIGLVFALKRSITFTISEMASRG
jgi:hypothetical protein